MDNERLARIEDKLDRVADSITEIKVTAAKQQVSLDEHIKRTNLLEDALKPVEKHVTRMNGVAKFIGAIAALIATSAGIAEILSLVFKR